MFNIIKKYLLKKKSKKVSKYIESIKIDLTLFKIIEKPIKKINRYIDALHKDSFYFDVVSRYNVYIKKVGDHNEIIRLLIVEYESLILNYPISIIINNILDFDIKKIQDIYSTVQSVYAYVVPNSFEKKAKFDEYKQSIEDIINNYEAIKEQKILIVSIYKEVDNLPDRYIINEEKNTVLENAFNQLAKYCSYQKKYYQTPVIDDLIIEEHNNQFIEKHLSDSIFDDVNGKSLDLEQRKAILCDAKSNLTIAGAGSGKTLTICGKVKFLLESGLAEIGDILLLSYSKASAKDLESKVGKIAKGVTVDTFHALGLKILTEVYGKKIAIEEQLKAYITRFFREELTMKPKIANDVLQYVALYSYAPPVNIKYNNDGELFLNLKKLDLRTLKDRLLSFSTNRRKRETLKNEYVKSNEELAIANYFFINGVKYEYERPYEIDTSTPDKRQYTPDFYLSDYGIYLEHYGIDREGNTPQYDKNASDEYKRSMQWKRQTHEANGTKCLETYSYEFNEGTLFDNLKMRLLENGVEFKPISSSEVFDALNNVYKGKDFDPFFNLITTFISLYKARYKDAAGFDKLKSQLRGSSYDIKRTRLFLDICIAVYDYYIQNLREFDKIDFDDMILQSTESLDGTLNFKYKYIIVDEFQDISQSRTRFLQKLIEHGNSKLFAVGDDWQAIYRFAGCDINVFLEFERFFSGAKLNFITSTHRNSSELQLIVEPFITANPNQYKKNIKSEKHQDKPVRIIYHKGNKSVAFTDALKDIYKINSNAKVLVLGRNRHDIDNIACAKIEVCEYKTITHYDFPSLEITYSTVHGSKGLESDFVILISGEDAQNGFPNKTEDDSILSLLLGKKDSFEYAEERRLFYVALTRTKSIVYLLSEKDRSSLFIKEIKSNCFIVNDRAEQEEVEYLCPWCKSGHLVIRTLGNDEKSFYGCSNYPYCNYINNDVKSVLRNKRCLECGDFLVLRNGRYSKFYGCHNYPRCKYTKSIEENTFYIN